MHRQLPKRFVLTDATRNIDPLEQLARLNEDDALVLRHYELSPLKRLNLAQALRQATKTAGVRFLIAGDDRLVSEVRADGLHLPSWLTKHGGVRTAGKPGWLVTAAAHNEIELRRAIAVGADAVMLSPVFPTRSHPGAPGLGVIRVAQLAAVTSIPAYALGGMTPQSMHRLRGIRQLAGWASVSAV